MKQGGEGIQCQQSQEVGDPDVEGRETTTLAEPGGGKTIMSVKPGRRDNGMSAKPGRGDTTTWSKPEGDITSSKRHPWHSNILVRAWQWADNLDGARWWTAWGHTNDIGETMSSTEPGGGEMSSVELGHEATCLVDHQSTVTGSRQTTLVEPGGKPTCSVESVEPGYRVMTLVEPGGRAMSTAKQASGTVTLAEPGGKMTTSVESGGRAWKGSSWVSWCCPQRS